MNEPQPVTMVALEDSLAKDDSGELLKDIRGKLEAQLADIRRHMDAGLPPDEYAKAEDLRAGVQAALTVAELFWKKTHRTA